MRYYIKVEPEARLELEDTISWYNQKQIGLGNRFYSYVKESFKEIKRNPFLYAIKYKNVRTLLMKKFPHMVHYYIEGHTIVVIGIIHTSRDPKIWDDRIQ